MIERLQKSSSSPLGATPSSAGVNFSVFSKHATGVELLLFDHVDEARAARIVRLDPSVDRTYHYWHAFVPDVKPGQLYGYRVEGPFDPSRGMRFDPTKVLLDPYGRGVAVPEKYGRDEARRAGANTATAMKSIVLDVSAYDWEADAPLQRPSSRWGLVAEQADMHRFVTVLNGCRVSRDIEHEQRVPLSQLIRQAHVIWHGVKLFEPDWSDASHSIAFTSTLPKRRMAFHAILNAYWEPLDCELPPVVVGRVEDRWRRWIDTFLDAPHDIVDWRDAPKVGGSMYRAEPRSVVVLFAPIDAQDVQEELS